MGLFGFGRKKAEMREECPPYLTGKEVRKLKQSLFSGEETPERICRMLGFAAPLLGKENQPIDALPQYRGKEEERLAAMYASSWGDPSYETLAEQVGHLVEGDQEEFLNQVNRILRAYPKSEWAGQASRLGGLDSSTLDKLERAEEILGMMAIYEIPHPESLAAFDLVRAANLVFVSIGLGYTRFSQDEGLLEQIAEKASGIYSGWAEYYGGYLLGRGLWAWSQGKYLLMNAPAVRNTCRVLLKAEESPMNRIPFKQGKV